MTNFRAGAVDKNGINAYHLVFMDGRLEGKRLPVVCIRRNDMPIYEYAM